MRKSVSVLVVMSAILGGFYAVTKIDWIFQIKNMPALDVRSFGAQCNGVFDDAPAIQSCLDSNTTGGTCALPKGVCVVGTGLTMTYQGEFLVGQPVADGAGLIPPSNNMSSWIVEKSGSNLAYVVRMNSSLQGIRDIVIDGNKANNSSAQDGVLINLSGGQDFDHLTVQNSKRYNLYVHSTNNESCCGHVISSMFRQSGSSNIFLDGGSANWLISQSRIESSGGDGIECNTCQSVKIIGSNFGQNSNHGFHAYGTPGGEHQVIGNLFAEKKHGIYIPDATQGNDVLSSNYFIPGPSVAATYDAIHVESCGGCSITGNTIVTGTDGSTFFNYRYGIAVDKDGGSSGGATVVANTAIGTFGSAWVFATSLVNVIGNGGPTVVGSSIGRSYFAAPIGEFPSVLSGAPASPNTGDHFYCTNCTTAATCATSGSGHLAVYNGTAWTCQ